MVEKHSNCWYKEVCENNCDSYCLRYEEMRYLVDTSNIPISKQYVITLEAGCDYDSFVRLAEIKDDILNFVNNSENLYITSRNTGNGKTSWAIKLLLKYFNEVWAGNGFKRRGLFIHVPTFLLQLKNFGDKNSELESIKKDLVDVDLVVFDDIGATGLSNYDLSQLLSYIDQRILCNKSNIFTSNLCTKNQLEAVLGTRLASRIWGTSQVIEFMGKDRR